MLRFDQGLLFYPHKTEIHTGWGKIIGENYYPHPSLTIDDLGRTGINMGSKDPSQTLHVNGKIKVGNDTNNDEKGVIKWDGSKFMGYDGEGWKSFQNINDADNDTKVFLTEGAIDSVIMQANGATNKLSYDGTRLNLSGNNIFIGHDAGTATTSGAGVNTVIGKRAGKQLSTGSRNTFIGGNTGEGITTGIKNTMIGAGSGQIQTNGSNNTFLGFNSGLLNNGSNNVFLGYEAGAISAGSNQLFIANNSTTTPLIYGDFSTNTLTINDDLEVSNSITSKEIILNDNNPKASFLSGGETKFDISYNSSTDQLTVFEQGEGTVLQIKDGVLTLPQYADNQARNLVINPDGSLSTSPLKQVFNEYDFNNCDVYTTDSYTCHKGVQFQDGQILSKMETLMRDDLNNEFTSMTLFRRSKLAVSGVQQIFKIESSDTNGSYNWFTDTSVNTPGSNVINNDLYHYYLLYYYYYSTYNNDQYTYTREVNIE
ncbi:autotransporter outer membrane beta-barrel domain-containing protein [Portibacter lacus]|uniref:Uncharacterized protein n=1 Tax=Portibacter lacus TaxID=1099794 RepID=A0AA37SL76_9BACT|nr:hypothetical protein [Portibacter lacus]GLR15679.1 hypothetical protein GCM10007940_02940 [Portibacter lacus]